MYGHQNFFFPGLDEDRTMLSKKVLIILAFIFGLSPSEIRDLKLKDLYRKNGKLYIRHFTARKVEKSCEIDNEKFSKIISKYFDRIFEDTGSTDGYLMRTIHGYKFLDKRMGINTMFGVGSDIAKYLKLENPDQVILC